MGSVTKPMRLQHVNKPMQTPCSQCKATNTLQVQAQHLHTSATAAPRQASPSAGCISSAGAKSALRQCCLKAS